MAKRKVTLTKEIDTSIANIDRLKSELEKEESRLSLLLKEKQEMDEQDLLELIKSKMTIEQAMELIMSR